jgi:hypothetical protein
MSKKKTTKSVNASQLAKLLGVSETAVRKARNTRRITPLPDGRYDPDQAKHEWATKSDPLRTKVRISGKVASKVRIRTITEARRIVSLPRRVLAENGIEVGSDLDLRNCLVAESILRSQLRDLRVREQNGELIRSEPVQKSMADYFSALRRRVQKHSWATCRLDCC